MFIWKITLPCVNFAQQSKKKEKKEKSKHGVKCTLIHWWKDVINFNITSVSHVELSILI